MICDRKNSQQLKEGVARMKIENNQEYKVMRHDLFKNNVVYLNRTRHTPYLLCL